MNLRKTCASIGLAGLAAAAFAASASASNAKTGVCTIQGNATANVNWASNTGTYNFGPKGLGITCLVARVRVEGGEATEAVTIAQVSASSAGGFDNIVCGTGTAADNNPLVSSVTTFPDDPEVETAILNADWGYNVVFLAFQGLLTWDHDSDEANGGQEINSPNSDLSETQPIGGGYVNLVPWHDDQAPGEELFNDPDGTFPGNPTGQCTNGFNVTAVVSATLGSV